MRGMHVLNAEHLLMTWDGTATLEDGTRRPIEYHITVGAARQYRDDPHPCQCENCLRVFPLATKLLAAQEDLLAGRVTNRQFERRLKRMGYRREGKIHYQ